MTEAKEAEKESCPRRVSLRINEDNIGIVGVPTKTLPSLQGLIDVEPYLYIDFVKAWAIKLNYIRNTRNIHNILPNSAKFCRLRTHKDVT